MATAVRQIVLGFKPEDIEKASEIYLTKRSKICIPYRSDRPYCLPELVASGNRNLASLGYTIDGELFRRLLQYPPGTVVDTFRHLTAALSRSVGAHRQYRPMYPNFPDQVIRASELELYANAMYHYWGFYIADITGNPNFMIMPLYEKEPRPPLPENETPLKIIGLGSLEDIGSMFTEVCGANSSLSDSDKEILSLFAKYEWSLDLLPEQIQQKETLAMLVSSYLAAGIFPSPLIHKIKTATDVLRIACVMSGGDVSLAKPTKFRSFTRPERRVFVSALMGCGDILEDMWRYRERWKRLGHGLHLGEFKTADKVRKAISVIRDPKASYLTFNGKIELAIARCDVRRVCDLLQERPGVFARRLDHLARLSSSSYPVDKFLEVADQVSTPVLVQLHAHFKQRLLFHKMEQVRGFMPKGQLARLVVKRDLLPPISPDVCHMIGRGVWQTLVSRFAKLSPLGKVFIDDELANQYVPFAMRSASKALRTLARGSTVSLPDCETIRLFLWWKQPENVRTDIDMSVIFLDENFKERECVSFRGLRTSFAVHSGDITAAPNGACEFIDIDLEKCPHRYAAMTLHSFTGQPYKDLPECFAGWMARTSPQSGEIFEPSTVQNKIDLACDGGSALPIVFDLKYRHAIWVDLITDRLSWRPRVAQDSSKTVAGVLEYFMQTRRPTCYDLFVMHSAARSSGRTSRDQADTIFSLNEGITPFDTTKILNEFLQ